MSVASVQLVQAEPCSIILNIEEGFFRSADVNPSSMDFNVEHMPVHSTYSGRDHLTNNGDHSYVCASLCALTLSLLNNIKITFKN